MRKLGLMGRTKILNNNPVSSEKFPVLENKFPDIFQGLYIISRINTISSRNFSIDKISNFPVNSLLLGIVVWGIEQLDTARPKQVFRKPRKAYKALRGLGFTK